MKVRVFGFCALLFMPAAARAADQALLDAARKEGQVTWYTTSIIDQFVRPAAEAFQSLYGVRVDYVRASPAELQLRVLNESRAGRMVADLVDGTTTSVVLKKEGLIEKWVPDHHLPSRYVDPEGYWLATNEYVLTPGYNTDLVAKDEVPKTFDDLLDPRWKGKITWNAQPNSSAGQGFVGLVLMDRGEEKGRAYLERLAKQDVRGAKTSARQVLDQVIAGEYPLALQIFNNHATISKSRGAPVDWIKMEPALAVVLPMSITKGAPHPNAAKLLFEFIESAEGQTLMAKSGELPVAPEVLPLVPELRPSTGNFRALYVEPERVAAQIAAWTKVYEEYFR